MHVTCVMPPARITPTFYKTCASTLMQVNGKPFAWFDRGQVQFQGIDIEEQQGDDFHVTWHFEVRIGEVEKTFCIDTKGEKYKINLTQLDSVWDQFYYTWLTYQDVETKTEEGEDNKEKISYARKCDSINLAQVFPNTRWDTNNCLKYCRPPKHQRKNWKKG